MIFIASKTASYDHSGMEFDESKIQTQEDLIEVVLKYLESAQRRLDNILMGVLHSEDDMKKFTKIIAMLEFELASGTSERREQLERDIPELRQTLVKITKQHIDLKEKSSKQCDAVLELEGILSRLVN